MFKIKRNFQFQMQVIEAKSIKQPNQARLLRKHVFFMPKKKRINEKNKLLHDVQRS